MIRISEELREGGGLLVIMISGTTNTNDKRQTIKIKTHEKQQKTRENLKNKKKFAIWKNVQKTMEKRKYLKFEKNRQTNRVLKHNIKEQTKRQIFM